MLCSPNIKEAEDQAKPPDKETISEKEKFSAIHLLHMSDQFRYGNLNKYIQNGLYEGREKCKTTYGGAYKLMI